MKKNATGRRKRLEDRKRRKREERKKQQRVAAQQTHSPRGRVRQAADWPVHEALVNADWREKKLATVVVARKRGGRITCGSYLADLGCLGIKNAAIHADLDAEQFAYLKERYDRGHPMTPCEPSLARKIVDTSVAYARELGFSPHPDYAVAKGLLTGIDPGECDEEVPCGLEGKPFFVQGPHDDARKIIAQLERVCGPGGFDFLALGESLD